MKAAAKVFADAGVESTAICLFNSFLNSAHERQAETALRESWDGDWVYASVDIAPIIGEYERTSTTVMNAYVAPRTVGYLRRLDERLRELGLPKGILLVQNNGGAISVARVAGQAGGSPPVGPCRGRRCAAPLRRSVGNRRSHFHGGRWDEL